MADRSVTVIIGVPGDGSALALLQPTLNSVTAAVENARTSGISCEVSQTPLGADPAPARNRAIRAAPGAYVAWIQAGDLLSANWISESLKLLLRHGGKRLILHPEVSLVFGGKLS